MSRTPKRAVRLDQGLDAAFGTAFADLAKLAYRVAYRLLGRRTEAVTRQLRTASGQQLRLPVHGAVVEGREVLELSSGSGAVVRAFEAGQAGGVSTPPPSTPAGVGNPQPCG